MNVIWAILIEVGVGIGLMVASVVITFIIMGFVMTGVHSRRADEADIKAFGKIQR